MENQISEIEHVGVVDHIEAGQAFVRVQSHTACGSCQAKGFCGMADLGDKIIEVSIDPDTPVKLGQQVTVALKRSLGFRALFLGYILPLLILLLSIIILISLTDNEGLSALLSLALMPPYYGILYLRREKIKADFNFRIKV